MDYPPIWRNYTELVGAEGIEPSSSRCRRDILPLNHAPEKWRPRLVMLQHLILRRDISYLLDDEAYRKALFLAGAVLGAAILLAAFVGALALIAFAGVLAAAF